MTVHETGTFVSGDGLRLFEQCWLPGTQPRGVVVIVHGYAEHSGRYDPVAAFLTARGYAVEAFDLRGHGQSEGPRAIVRTANEYLLDLGRFLRRVRERHPGLPLFLLGYSMGGLIVALYGVTRRPSLDGMILIGPALSTEGGPAAMNLAATPVGHLLAVSWRQPALKPAMKLAVTVLGRLVPESGLRPLDAATISKDPEAVHAFIGDPLVYTGKMKFGILAAMMRAIARVDRDAEEIELPLLVMHGRDDRPAPAAASELLYARAASRDKALQVYDGLWHGIFIEPEQEKVLGDLAGWLDAHTTPRDE